MELFGSVSHDDVEFFAVNFLKDSSKFKPKNGWINMTKKARIITDKPICLWNSNRDFSFAAHTGASKFEMLFNQIMYFEDACDGFFSRRK